MTSYEIKVTWVEDGSRNAAGIGHDEIVIIEAESVAAALKEAVECHQYNYEYDWETGKYCIVAEHVDGGEAITSYPEESK